MKFVVVIMILLVIMAASANAKECENFNKTKICGLHPVWYGKQKMIYDNLPLGCKKEVKTVLLYDLKKTFFGGRVWWNQGVIHVYSVSDWNNTIIHECQHLTESGHIAWWGVTQEYYQRFPKWHLM